MNFDSSDLRDPHPPLPGEPERTKVAARAHELGRRRRLAQGGGALAVVAAVAVSVAALTAGGGSGPGNNRVEAASSASDTSVSTSVSHVTTAPTTVPAPADTTVAPAPAPAPDTAPAAAQEAPAVAPQSDAPVQPATPTTFTLSGTVTGNPADTTVSVTVDGPGGHFDFAGTSFSVSGLPAGDYLVVATWEDSTGTAAAAVKQVVSLTGDQVVNLAFG
jgi:hypothetical protein